MMCHCDRTLFTAAGRLTKSIVAKLASGFLLCHFLRFRIGRYVKLTDLTPDPVRITKFLHKRSVTIRFFSPDPMMDMYHAKTVTIPVLQLQQHPQKAHGICPAGYSCHDIVHISKHMKLFNIGLNPLQHPMVLSLPLANCLLNYYGTSVLFFPY